LTAAYSDLYLASLYLLLLIKENIRIAKTPTVPTAIIIVVIKLKIPELYAKLCEAFIFT